MVILTNTTDTLSPFYDTVCKAPSTLMELLNVHGYPYITNCMLYKHFLTTCIVLYLLPLLLIEI